MEPGPQRCNPRLSQAPWEQRLSWLSYRDPLPCLGKYRYPLTAAQQRGQPSSVHSNCSGLHLINENEILISQLLNHSSHAAHVPGGGGQGLATNLCRAHNEANLLLRVSLHQSPPAHPPPFPSSHQSSAPPHPTSIITALLNSQPS